MEKEEEENKASAAVPLVVPAALRLAALEPRRLPFVLDGGTGSIRLSSMTSATELSGRASAGDRAIERSGTSPGGGSPTSATTKRRRRDDSMEAESSSPSTAAALVDSSSSIAASCSSDSGSTDCRENGSSPRSAASRKQQSNDDDENGTTGPHCAISAAGPSSSSSKKGALADLSTAMSMTTSRHDYDNYDPVRGMVHSWVCCIMVPAAAVAWKRTHSLAWTAFATLAAPLLAIAQGTVGILHFRKYFAVMYKAKRYRGCPLFWLTVLLTYVHIVFILSSFVSVFSGIWFGDAPLPQTPTHGVVLVRGDNDSRQKRGSAEEADDEAATTTTTTTTTRRSLDEETLLLEEAVRHPPVRLLVIGDSLAIGVGQSEKSTPVMPEVIAKTISRKLGRVVYWTCHGAPGASTGWIVRELERGVPVADDEEEEEEETLNEDEDDHELLISMHTRRRDATGAHPRTQSCVRMLSGGATNSETDESSSSDESASDQELHCPLNCRSSKSTGVASVHLSSARQHLKLWKERLANHRKRFNPDVLGPYDVVVVLTGSNDLKSAFFPFLLTGEDAEFRRQARLRGGNYNNELRRLVETVYRKMRLKWQSWRVTVMEQVEAATESMREKMLTMEARIGIHGNKSGSARISPRRGNKRQSLASCSSSSSAHMSETGSKTMQEEQSSSEQEENSRHFPLVVLPGMPARALPIFRTLPLRWLAVPIVDIMDKHKRNLAQCHPGEVLFVDAPSIDELTLYENEQGDIWSDHCGEDTVLALRDIRKSDRHRIERHMKEYYGSKKIMPGGAATLAARSLLSRHPFRAKCPDDLFSADRVHPNDLGYDFWGRHIGNAIVAEWHRKSSNDD